MKTTSLIFLLSAASLCAQTTHRFKQGDQLEGPESPNIEFQTIRVEAEIVDPPKNGVILSHGGFVSGYALFVRQGKPVFAIRRGKEAYTEVVGPPLKPGATKLAGQLLASGTVTLLVNGKPAEKKQAGGLLEHQPGDGLAVGDDPKSNVGTYQGEEVFKGTIQHVSVTLKAAGLPSGPTHSLRTRWAKDLDPDHPWPEYPRPQLVRKEWTNLNGSWDYAIRPRKADAPATWDGKILVPFPVESQLSGVQRYVGAANRLWYRSTFGATPSKGRLLLHFGAVDWETEVRVNGKVVGRHKGGYDPFSFDITDAVKNEGPNELLVAVWDPTDTGSQPRGKQVTRPKGIWYTPVSGIWQTVWLEPVPATYIESLKIAADPKNGQVEVQVTIKGEHPDAVILADLANGETTLGTFLGKEGVVRFRKPSPKAWTPDHPVLNNLTLRLALPDTQPLKKPLGEMLDRVETYFAFRSIERKPDAHGIERLWLNGKSLFQYGPLDQGWWPDGLYTAPTDEALRYDIEITKAMGFNMIRKHVKVEPARWYAHCDRIGMLVWQDMPNAFAIQDRAQAHVKAEATADWKRPPDSAMQFETELREMIQDFGHFPSIVMWVPLNEGWGQYDTARLANWTRELDPTRLVNAISGWADRTTGDVLDLHHYPGPGMEPIEQHPHRAVVLGEFGGLGLAMEGHLLLDDKNWGYKSFATREELATNYRALMRNLRPMIHRGLAAAVYTQTTDVETEVNGLLTYDRAVIKMAPETLAHLHQGLYRAPGQTTWLLRDSEVHPQPWRFTAKPPGDGWIQAGFDDSSWQQGPSPFKSDATGFFNQGTPWKEPTLWLRHSFELEEKPSGLSMKLFCDAEGELFLNGKKIHELQSLRIRRHYDDINISQHAGLLKKRRNTIAVRLKKAQGHRGFDLGLYAYEADEPDLATP